MKIFNYLLLMLLCCLPLMAEQETRKIFHQLVKGEVDPEITLQALADTGDSQVVDFASGWKLGRFFETPDGGIVYKQADDSYNVLLTGKLFEGDVESLKVNRASRGLRKSLTKVLNVVELASPDYRRRSDAAIKLGAGQNPDYIEELKVRAKNQPNTKLTNSFNEAIQLSLLKNGSEEEQLNAVKQLGELESVTGRDFLITIKDNADKETEHGLAMINASEVSLAQIETYEGRIEFIGSLFRGLSTGSILLIVSYGLAITFGLMGVINMAHGEFIAIGAYSVYVVQNIFLDVFEPGSPAHEMYFICALPVAFIVAALFGALLERGVIQFLYKRPLESLLATWGISMLMKQVMRDIFGSKGVSVSSPEWITGSLEIAGISLTYNRIAVIAFSVVVILMTWLLLNRSRVGLHIRATMQNRLMASSLGIPSSKINVMTFAYGSGLAGLAGAFISQIDNVSPEMGGAYIVDSFMVVVVGGVGNLMGAALSSMGIGLTDQILQPYVGPVMGKIIVLVSIILFLQWRPGGLFPSRSRSLDD